MPNVIGVQVTAPLIDKKAPSLSSNSRVTATVKATKRVRLRFLLHCLLRDFGHPA